MTRIVNAKRVAKKGKTHDVSEVSPFTYRVVSGASRKAYTVKVQHNQNTGLVEFTGATCNCRWGQFRSNKDNGRSGCSHVQAVFAQIERGLTGKSTSAWATFDDAQRQNRHVLAIGDGVYLTTRKAGT